MTYGIDDSSARQRQFWIDLQSLATDSLVVHALLSSESREHDMESRTIFVPSLPVPEDGYLSFRRHVGARTPCSPLPSYWKPVDHRALDTSLLDNMRTDATLSRDALRLSECTICLKARPSLSRSLLVRIWAWCLRDRIESYPPQYPTHQRRYV